MNALATDQAKRIAHLIHTIPALAGLRAGLYIGDQEEVSTIAMGPEQVITDRTALHKAPPDILLTNYKQLDYLLLQPQTQGLWAHNTQLESGTSVLRYLVVDEFHTFDGAQGTDLACLIRRLRDRLGGPGAESKAEMLSYAGQIFASRFEPNSLIEEEQLSPEEFFTAPTAFGGEGLFALPLPGLDHLEALDPEAKWAAGYLDRPEAHRVGSTAGGFARIGP